MNPMTQYRIHPVELILNNARGILGFGVVTGIFDYYSNHELDTVVFIGANVFTFLFMFFGANLRHSHVKLKYPSFLEYIFISPYQHQIHHSINKHHYDKNMGSKLAIWDFIFGTLILSKETSRIRFGVAENQRDFSSFTNLIWLPFLKAFNIIKFLKKVRNKDA
jgi:sterol desaturase/sphingolipid hydroxylase (fatty acid hydroxylase superfamily)